MRYLFYDTRSGEIIHAHEAIHVGAARDEAADVASARKLVEREHDRRYLNVIKTSAQPRSSRESLRHVDPTAMKLRTRRTPKDHWTSLRSQRAES